MKVLALVAALLLAGCSSIPTTKTVTVDVPVAQKCKPDVGPAPSYPDTPIALLSLPFPDAAAKLRADSKDVEAAKQVSFNVFYEVRLLAAGRIMRIARENQLETALKGCE